MQRRYDLSSGLKQFALKYVPGVRTLRDVRDKLCSINDKLCCIDDKLYHIKHKLHHVEHKLLHVDELQTGPYLPEETLLPLLPHFMAQLLRKLAPWESANIPLIRLGKEADGGYVMGDVFDKVDAAYSFGIANDVTWDKEIADRSIPVFMYDHTIDKLPEEHPNFHFFKTGVCGKPHLPGMKDVGTLIQENGHRGKNLLMKMDIEGFEYPSIHALEDEDIAQFTQICVEIHDLQAALFNTGKYFFFSECLEKILKHMHCVHLHVNNNGGIVERNGVKIPVLLELTFIRKDMADDFKRTDKLRTDLDRPNIPSREEIDVHFLWKQTANSVPASERNVAN